MGSFFENLFFGKERVEAAERERERTKQCPTHGCYLQSRQVESEPTPVAKGDYSGNPDSITLYEIEIFVHTVWFCPRCEEEDFKKKQEEELQRKKIVRAQAAQLTARACKELCKCMHRWKRGEIFCPNCGQQNPNPGFCPRCGDILGTCAHAV